MINVSIRVVNELLGLQAVETNDGRMVKCWVSDPEGGGVNKTYLERADCEALANAFATIAASLKESEE